MSAPLENMLYSIPSFYPPYLQLSNQLHNAFWGNYLSYRELENATGYLQHHGTLPKRVQEWLRKVSHLLASNK
ncbi:MAG: hypothetical protein Sylvanvirus9_30 [Sylvanvirus sp.]|uniref:Uncharacterized protein n=1 Tax=Sylvanvirus sp. TaxID=2487774 RepID=A0A3G5AHZ8_9VIRU|nr:MAG: hypothetical protein Sylvanvirus9_30 [Sylvanvirus sp.]